MNMEKTKRAFHILWQTVVVCLVNVMVLLMLWKGGVF